MLATCPMKVRQTDEWDLPGLPQQLKDAAKRSEKSVSQICREANISTTFWYQVVKGNKESISLKTLKALCKALGISLDSLGLNPD